MTPKIIPQGKKMSTTFKSILNRLTPASSTDDIPKVGTQDGAFTREKSAVKLFPKTDPAVDGEDCLHDCASCSVKLPRKWSIDEDDKLYGEVNGWETHIVIATGKTDWVRDVADEKGSIMEALEKGSVHPSNGKMKISASNMPMANDLPFIAGEEQTESTVLLLPAMVMVDSVTPKNVPELVTSVINTSPTNTQPIFNSIPKAIEKPTNGEATPPKPSTLKPRPCPHDYLILLCSQATRDARCGQSAPLLRKEFERHLRPLGLYRDLHDQRPGGVGIYFISHVGGHKYSANVIIYRRSSKKDSNGAHAMEEVVQEQADDPALKVGAAESGEAGAAAVEPSEIGNVVKEKPEPNREAAQCIWLARVRPEDCENIIRYTVLQGKVVKPERQLRGGFDRERGVVSW